MVTIRTFKGEFVCRAKSAELVSTLFDGGRVPCFVDAIQVTIKKGVTEEYDAKYFIIEEEYLNKVW